MTYAQFTTTFKNHINKLSFEKQIALALAVCKKLFFDYKHFVEVHQWGDTDLLMDAIIMCEQQKKQPNIEQINAMLLKVDAITPDMDDFGDLLGSYALNASNAVYDALEFLIDKNPEHIHNIGTYLTDTIDFRIRGDADLTPQQIDAHPLMIDARNLLLSQIK